MSEEAPAPAIPENEKMTAAFVEIFTRQDDEGQLVYSREDQLTLAPIFLLKVADHHSREELPEKMQIAYGKAMSVLGIRDGMSEEEASKRVAAYLVDVIDGGFNQALLDEVKEVFVQFGMEFLELEQARKGHIYEEFTDTKREVTAPRESPLKVTLSKPPRRGLS